MSISFRRLTRDDLPLLAEWLGDPGVHRWWYSPTAMERVEGRYGPSIDGDDPTEVWLALEDDRPFGFLLCVRFVDEPEQISDLEPLVGPIDPHAASIDYLIGGSSDRGRGLGARMIDTFVAELLARDATVPYLLVPVHVENRASWRALELAGFRVVGRGDQEPSHPDDSPEHLVLRRDR